MKKQFIAPDFTKGGLEVRLSDAEVALYFSGYGLIKFTMLLEDLLRKGNGEHIHLEDVNLLTTDSMSMSIVFVKDR